MCVCACVRMCVCVSVCMCVCVCVVFASTEDLPRMSSIQSDSSGFGDTEVSGDNAAQEMASLKVVHTVTFCLQASVKTVI